MTSLTQRQRDALRRLDEAEHEVRICKWKLAGVTALWLLSVSALGVLITFTAVTYGRIDMGGPIAVGSFVAVLFGWFLILVTGDVLDDLGRNIRQVRQCRYEHEDLMLAEFD